jgi:chromosome segregation ATPase
MDLSPEILTGSGIAGVLAAAVMWLKVQYETTLASRIAALEDHVVECNQRHSETQEKYEDLQRKYEELLMTVANMAKVITDGQ